MTTNTSSHRPRLLLTLRLAGCLTLLSAVNNAVAQQSEPLLETGASEKLDRVTIIKKPQDQVNENATQSSDEPLKIQIKNITRTPQNLLYFLGDHSEANKISRYIINGKWDRLDTELLKNLPKEKATAVYLAILNNLVETTDNTAPSQCLMTFDDVIEFAAIAPFPLAAKDVAQFGLLNQKIISSGSSPDELLRLLKKNPDSFAQSSYLRKKNTALLLFSSGLPQEAAEYLPSIQEVKSKRDYEMLRILLLPLVKNAKSPKEIQRVWELNEWALAQKDFPESLLPPFLNHTLDLLSVIDENTRKQWLRTMATEKPEMLNTFLKGFYYKMDESISMKDLPTIEKQFEIWNTIFHTSTTIPQFATSIYQPWKDICTSFSLLWVEETKRAEEQEKANRSLTRGKRVLDFLNAEQLLKLDPITPELLTVVGHDVAHKLLTNRVHILVTLGRANQALKAISSIASYAPKQARQHAESLLISWAQHATLRPPEGNPSGDIPLTLIRQKRNIETLAQLYKKIKAMNIGEIKDSTIIKAFALCHSRVEIYNLSDIEAVFGPISQLSTPKIIALSKNMNHSLSLAWSSEKLQKRYRTGRSPAELKKSLDAGFDLQLMIINQSLEHRADYQLRTLLGDTYLNRSKFIKKQIDQNNTRYQKENILELIQKALQNYELAVAEYQTLLKKNPQTNYDITPFSHWFEALVTSYASEDRIKSANLESWGFSRLRKELLATSNPDAHLNLFGKLMNKLPASGEVADKKARLEASLLVLKDHPSADFSLQHIEYYKELIKEIQLHTELVSASPTSKDLGLLISLHHTDKISRECHGFYQFIAPKKLNEPNPSQTKFTQTITQILSKQFEVKSITLAPQGTRPRPLISNGTPKKDWSETPLAYVYLVKKSVEADQIPAVSMDLPFVDSTGRVIISFNSNIIPLSAQSQTSTTVPTPKNLRVFQTLNERTHDKEDNTVSLEIRATADGIIPPIDQILNLSFKNFKIVSQIDEGMQVNQLVLRNEKNPSDHPETERNWTITLKLPDFSPNKPTKFHFPTPKDANVPVVYHRYVDVDLVEVDSIIDFNAAKMKSHYAWVWWLILIPALGLGLWFFFYKKHLTGDPVEEKSRYSLPESLNPFTCAALLMTIRKDGVVVEPKKQKELDTDIQMVEAAGFAPKEESKIDLKKISQKWIQIAN